MTITQIIEKYEGWLSSNPEFEPLLGEVIGDLKKLDAGPKVNLTTEKECIDPEFLNLNQ